MKPMMGSNGLLECRACGSLDVFRCAKSSGWVIECDECGKKGDKHLRICTAVREWNTRNGHLYTADDYKQDAEERKHGL